MALTVGELVGVLTIDDAEFTQGLDRAEGQFSSTSDKITKGATAAGTAAVAVGTAFEGFARKSAEGNKAVQRLSASTGIQADAMRDLILETSNVTFPLDEVTASMEAGRQQGLKSADQLQEFATFWDVVGDATGESGPALAEAGVALRAVGIAAGQESQALGAFGFITQETTGSVTDFLAFLERTGPELRTMGADVDDAAAIMGVLEGELGMTGRTARTEFRAAINEADGDMGQMLKTLGISQEQFEAYRGKVDESSDVLQRNADIHADSFTPMQKMQHAAEELMFKYGDLADAAGTLSMPLIAIGMAAIGAAKLFASAGAQKVASMIATSAGAVAHSAVVVARWALMGTQAMLHGARVAAAWLIAMGPVGLVIATVVGLVALIIANWDTVKRVTVRVWNAVWKWVSDRVTDIANWVRRRIQDVISFFGWLGSLPGKVAAWFGSVKDWAVRKLGELVSWMAGLPGRVLGAIGDIGGKMVQVGKDIIGGIVRGLGQAAGWIWDKLSGILSGAWDNVLGFFGISSPSKEGIWAGEMIGLGLARGIGSMGGTVEAAAARLAESGRIPIAETELDPARLAAGSQGDGGAIADQFGTGAGSRGDGITVEHLEVKAFSDKFSLSQVQDELALNGVS
jgi:hypothetical protein